MSQQIRYAVLAAPILAMFCSLLLSVMAEAEFLAAAHKVNRFILDHFYEPISWTAALACVALLVLAASPLGRMKLGGESAEKRLTPWTWVSIALCTTVAMGMMFWGVAEPITHLGAPGPAGLIKPRTPEAAAFALSSSFFHWSVLPYAIYCFAGLTLALLCLKPSSGTGVGLNVSAPFHAVFGASFTPRARGIIDAVALFALVAGVASSIGTAVLSLSGGIANLTNSVTTGGLSFVVTSILVISFLTSSISGLHRGVALLSDLNAKIFLLFLLLVAIVYPPSGYSDLLVKAFADFSESIIGKSAVTHPVAQSIWYRDWTTFYLANWYAWAPVTAIFLAYIARGYTVRAFVLVNFILPSLFACLWLGLLGGAALTVDLETGTITAAMDKGGAEAALYAFIALFPWAKVIIPAFLVMSFLSFVTAADSNMLSIVSMCTRNPDQRTETRLKIIWGVMLGLTGWLMVTIAGVDGLRILNSIGGLPALFVIIGYGAAMAVWLMRGGPKATTDSGRETVVPAKG